MAFKVRFSGQGQPTDYGDEDGFEFLEGGVLAIHYGDQTRWSEFYPPVKWDHVAADPDHLAGLNTPYVEDDEDDDEYEDEEYEDEDAEDDEYKDAEDEPDDED